MIEKIKSKNIADGSKVSMNLYGSSALKGPFISFIQNENNENVNIQFDRAFAEDARYADKTYVQLVTEALAEIEKGIDLNKKIELTAWGKNIEIPREIDSFELQQIISNFVINNAILDTKEQMISDSETKLSKNSFYMQNPYKSCLSYLQQDYSGATNIKFEIGTSKTDITFMQMAVEALNHIDKEIDKEKKLNLKVWDRTIEIPRGVNKYEIQELLTNFVLKNASFESDKKDLINKGNKQTKKYDIER